MRSHFYLQLLILFFGGAVLTGFLTANEGDIEAIEESGNSSLICRSNVNLSIGGDGYTVLEPSMLLADVFPDYSIFRVRITDPNLGHDTVRCDLVGDEIMVEVTNTLTGNRCWSNVLVEDKLPPIATCDTVILDCSVDPYEENRMLYLNGVQDNCTPLNDLGITFTQHETTPPCHSNYTFIVDRTWFITDASGNQSQCSQTILFERPNLVDIDFPADDTVYCPNTDTSELITGVPTLGGLEIPRLCGLMVWSSDQVFPKCGNTFKVMRTWNVMDWCTGQQRMDIQTIYVLDTTPPVISLPDTIRISTVFDECFGLYSLSNVSVSDDCSDPQDIRFDVYINGVLTQQPNNIQLPQGSNNVRIVARDDCLNESEDEFVVIVRDTENPTLVCNNEVISIPGFGTTTITPNTFTGFTYTDNCAIQEVQIRRMSTNCGIPSDLQFGDNITICCEDVGDTLMVEVRAVDQSGNPNSCMFELVVQDKIPPMIICPADQTISCDQIPNDFSGFGSPTIMDNCAFTLDSVESISLNNCQEGIIIRTWTVTDAAGNDTSCSQIITVENPYSFDTNSIVWPGNIEVSACNNGGLSPQALNSFPSFTPTPCRTEFVRFSDMVMNADSACLNLMRTWTIIDSCTLDEYQHIQMVRVINNGTPVLTVPDDVTLIADLNCEAQTSLPAAFTNDCSSGVTITNSYDNQGATVSGTFPVGSTTIIFTATDECGNQSTDQTIITVIDTVGPSISCPQDMTLSLNQNCGVSVPDLRADIVVVDNCDPLNTIQSVVQNPAPGSTITGVSSTTISYLIITTQGDTFNCISELVTIDEIDPVLNCISDDTLYVNNSCQVEVPNYIASANATDNCTSTQDLVFIQEPAPNSIISADVPDTLPVRIIVTDESNNQDTCFFEVVVIDTTRPDLQCTSTSIDVYLDQNCQAIVPNVQANIISVTDNCTPTNLINISQSPSPGSTIDISTTEVIITVTDESGNENTCIAPLNLIDTIGPSVSCAQDVTLSLDQNCEVVVPDLRAQIMVSDNCGGQNIAQTIVQNPTPGSTLSGVSTTTVSYLIITTLGDTFRCASQLITIDEIDPVLNCITNDLLHVDPNCQIQIPNYISSANGTDNCTSTQNLVYVQEPAPNTIFSADVPDTIPVRIIVSDESNNQDTCFFNVFVIDTIRPDLQCSATPIELFLDQNCEAVVPNVQANIISVTDNCTPSNLISITQSPSPGTTIDISTTEVIITVMDESGNENTCIAPLDVIDTIPPTIICPPDTAVNCNSPLNDLSVFGFATAFDNCTPVQISEDSVIFQGTCGIDSIHRIFTAIDDNGIQAQCIQTIRLSGGNQPLEESDFVFTDTLTYSSCDAIPPLAGAPMISPSLSVCNIIGLTVTDSVREQAEFACIEIERTFTVIDSCYYDPTTGAGVLTFEQLILVIDNQAPSFNSSPMDTTVFLDSCGLVELNIPAVTAFDCAGVARVFNNSPYSFSDTTGDISGLYEFGVHPVTIYAEDSCGNIDSINLTVTVNDTFPDSLACRFKIAKILDTVTLVAIFHIDEYIQYFGDSCGNAPLETVNASFSNTDPFDSLFIVTCDSLFASTGSPNEYLRNQFAYIFINGVLVDSCAIEIGVVDEFLACSQTLVAGSIMSPGVAAIKGVEVTMSSQDQVRQTTTNQEGHYQFVTFDGAGGKRITARKEKNPLQGINTLDVIRITRQVLGIETIDNPYYLAAADVDKSRTITGADIIHLRKLILHIEDKLPVDNWRFLPEDYRFRNPSKSYEELYDEYLILSGGVQEVYDANMIGLKVGDVDGSADQFLRPRSTTDLMYEQSNGILDLYTENDEILYGFQCELSVEHTNGIWLSSEQIDLNHEHYAITEEGNILISWTNPFGRRVDNDKPLFRIHGLSGDQKNFAISEESLDAQMYLGESLTTHQIQLQARGQAQESENWAIYQNQPNPWQDYTVISYSLSYPQQVELIITDASGKNVFSKRMEGDTGVNQFMLHSNQITQSGVYYYTIHSEESIGSKTMIRIE